MIADERSVWGEENKFQPYINDATTSHFAQTKYKVSLFRISFVYICYKLTQIYRLTGMLTFTNKINIFIQEQKGNWGLQYAPYRSNGIEISQMW